MLLLAIDTCGATGTVALASLDDTLRLIEQTELAGKTYSARLVPAIRSLLAAHDATLAAIATVVVTKGPGSFTGIRIGLSTAKGLAEPNSIPLLAVSRLGVLANKAQAQAAALDASRSEFYFGDFSDPVASEKLIGRETFLALAGALGRQLAVCEPSLHGLAPGATLVDSPTAFDALRSVLPRLRAGEFDDPLLLDGNYIRRSDAEIFSGPGASAPGTRSRPPVSSRA